MLSLFFILLSFFHTFLFLWSWSPWTPPEINFHYRLNSNHLFSSNSIPHHSIYKALVFFFLCIISDDQNFSILFSRASELCLTLVCLGQKNFVRDKIFWSPVKSSFLFMRIQFRSCSKFFVRDKNFLSRTKFFFVPDKIFLSRTKNILSMQKDEA